MEHFRKRLDEIVAAAPKDWYGTTFPNDYRFRGRDGFIDEMLRLLKGTDLITKEHLAQYFPEDYVRLGSPFSTLLEVFRAIDAGFDPKLTFAYASVTLPLVAVFLTAQSQVRVHYRDDRRLFSEDQEDLLRKSYGCKFTTVQGDPEDNKDSIVVLVTDSPQSFVPEFVHAVVSFDGFLYVQNTDKVRPFDTVVDGQRLEGVHTIRKRLGAAPPTPDARALLCGEPLHEIPDTTELQNHLKRLAGCSDNTPGEVLLGTVGLSALGACVMGALDIGQRDIDSIMCSTAYGGSSQQTDILSTRCQSELANMERHKFNIQGASGDVFKALTETLARMKNGPRKPLAMIQIEYPTNPDMKDCDLGKVEKLIEEYREATGTAVLLLLDTTFCPPSAPLKQLQTLPVIVFNSLSKSVTGGYTTGGSLVANDTSLAQSVLRQAHEHLRLLDTGAKGCQLQIFNEMHPQCELRVKQAHDNCVAAAAVFEKAVQAHSGQVMKVNFVTKAQIAKGVTPATFSFNLPPPKGSTQTQREAFAQDLVDALANSQFGKSGQLKPCVSFGQRNSTIYATVPATSTQGVISKELTSKQALGGIQLVRFSFPTTMDISAFEVAVNEVLKAAYNTAPHTGSSKVGSAGSYVSLIAAGVVAVTLVTTLTLMLRRRKATAAATE